jgi:hypothetical protein
MISLASPRGAGVAVVGEGIILSITLVLYTMPTCGHTRYFIHTRPCRSQKSAREHKDQWVTVGFVFPVDLLTIRDANLRCVLARLRPKNLTFVYHYRGLRDIKQAPPQKYDSKERAITYHESCGGGDASGRRCTILEVVQT